MNKEVELVYKAFRKTRKECEQLMYNGLLTWADFEDIMRDFESQLRGLGVDL